MLISIGFYKGWLHGLLMVNWPTLDEVVMSDQVKSLLIALEVELKHLSLWQPVLPSPEALASAMPFCYDTMSLQQWLQFVFIPRMQALLDANGSLPGRMSILPVAEQAFGNIQADVVPLLNIIQRLDNAISGDA
jgi:uncharacterized protein YqcC (DUF446 family)